MVALQCTGDYITLLVRINIRAFAAFKQQLRQKSGEIASTVEVREQNCSEGTYATNVSPLLCRIFIPATIFVVPRRNVCSRSLGLMFASLSSSSTKTALVSALRKMIVLAWRS
jgi:hypothetical protein